MIIEMIRNRTIYFSKLGGDRIYTQNVRKKKKLIWAIIEKTYLEFRFWFGCRKQGRLLFP